MAIPYYANAFTTDVDDGSSVISLYPPSGATTGDIILNWLIARPYYANPTTWNGYSNPGTLVAQYNAYGTYMAIYWQRLSGWPSMGYYNTNWSAMGMATVAIRGCITTGTPYEWVNQESIAWSSSYSIASRTTLGPDRLIFHGILAHSEASYIWGPTYYTQHASLGMGSGLNFIAAAQSYGMASAGSSPADSGTLSVGQLHMGVTLSMIPPPPPGYANKVNGVASANIGKVDGVATANIDNVIGV